MIRSIAVKTPGQGLHEVTYEIVSELRDSGLDEGLCTIFLQHTSASLTIQENADPSAKRDLEHWMNRLVPENDPEFTHTHEGPDDMPSHIKAALTANHLSIPFVSGELVLGTWQGIYLWEHRRRPHTRKLVLHFAE